MKDSAFGRIFDGRAKRGHSISGNLRSHLDRVIAKIAQRIKPLVISRHTMQKNNADAARTFLLGEAVDGIASKGESRLDDLRRQGPATIWNAPPLLPEPPPG